MQNGLTYQQVVADDAYLVESLRQPNAKVVVAYPSSVMPAYDTLLKDDEVSTILAYLHTLEKR